MTDAIRPVRSCKNTPGKGSVGKQKGGAGACRGDLLPVTPAKVSNRRVSVTVKLQVSSLFLCQSQRRRQKSTYYNHASRRTSNADISSLKGEDSTTAHQQCPISNIVRRANQPLIINQMPSSFTTYLPRPGRTFQSFINHPSGRAAPAQMP
ncbi:hypothetical protein VTN02DRAFT_6402 [Thermoascus thermophilus]